MADEFNGKKVTLYFRFEGDENLDKHFNLSIKI